MGHAMTRAASRMKAIHLLKRTGHASGGAIGTYKSGGTIPPVVAKSKLKTGGAVEGKASGGRLDKLARGGKHGKKPHVTVNVMNHPSTPISPQIPPIPVGLGGAGPRPPMAPPSAPPTGPMGPGGPPMGPGGMKTGGKIKKRAVGGPMGRSMGAPTQGYSTSPTPQMPVMEKHLKSGGRLGGKAAPHMTGGAASGVGREEKSELVKEKPKAR